MRPEILFPLFGAVTSLTGVGPRIGQHLERLTGGRIVDLLWHLPAAMIDRRWQPTIGELVEARDNGRVATLTITVGKHEPPRVKRVPYRITCFDETNGSDEIRLVFFHGDPKYLNEQLPEGQERVISGRIEFYSHKPQMSHPDYMVAPGKRDEIPAMEPIYPLTQGLASKTLQKAIHGALERTLELPEWQDAAFFTKQAKQEGWLTWREALIEAHSPLSAADLSPKTPARARLAYDELLANQLALGLVRHHQLKRKGRAVAGTGRLREKMLAALPYSLTGAQAGALAEIDADMASDSAMLRLVQGDVGCGKTIVAFLAMATAVEADRQAAMLAPTEILARQHYDALEPLAEAAGFEIAILTGRHKGKGREVLLARLAAGEIDMLIGTHALFQQDVDYHDLALAVIDEQHRFGVYQRLTLADKGAKDGARDGKTAPDVLVMTATPIPRTLTLTVYGDMDVSRITEKPPGRQPIETRVLPLGRLDAVIDAAERAMKDNRRVYWVCPLVEESELIDLAAAEDRYAALKQRFGARVGLIHGRMKAAEKDAAMAAFQSGEVAILVATTVIEVGVDVPEASVMIIEHAERFGLAQLHQLRGRVGRGADKSACLLLRAEDIGETAAARLRIMRETDDGFLIAEEDLRLRGAGELLGTRQSGLPTFRVADIEHHGDLLAIARDDARLVVATDPDLNGTRGEALRVLLYLFERDVAAGLLKSG